jgi:hypothetical protein
MRKVKLIVILLIMLNTGGCIFNYIPRISDSEELLVVEGLITDQPGAYTIKISKSQPLWKRVFPAPLKGCQVSITDDLGRTFNVNETPNYGTYTTDPLTFRGTPGRKYTLHVRTTTEPVNYSYESIPMEMKPVPPIDSIYYEKATFSQAARNVEGCNIFLNTRDPSQNCSFYRWEYSETWEIHLPFATENRICWITNSPKNILIKNATLLNEGNILRYPVISITNPVDRLSIKYSLLAKQFSLNEDEYLYWERLKNTIDQTGGLYDIIPAVIPNNIFCIEESDKKVLGYFSVSAVSSKRKFIKDKFAGFDAQYMDCITDSIRGSGDIPGLNSTVWVLIERPDKSGTLVRYLTTKKGCADCTTRGTTVKPVFWDDEKSN